MTDFRKEMAEVSENALKCVNEIANPKWAIPFLGRRLNVACKDKFKNADTKGFKLELPWEGQVKYESHNAYDDSTYVHELVVEVYPEGPAVGRIKSVHAHHWEYWHTSSNWQDHSESATWEKREPNDKEISQYRELLEGWTEGGSSELVQALCHALMAVVRLQGGKTKVEFCDRSEENQPSYRAISISFSRDESPSTVNIDINLDHIIEALDYSRIFINVMNSKEDRQQLGICKDESWTLQYCLNLFNVFKAEPLYQNIDISLKAWLYKLYTTCSYYRNFMNAPQDMWWRDAWWRLQEIVGGKERTLENQFLINENLRGSGYRSDPYFKADPLGDLVGKISMPYERSISPFSIDTAIMLSRPVKGGRERYAFSTATINGVKWSICNHSCDEIAIDLASSDAVEDLKDDVVIIPYQINGRPVTSIHMIDTAVEKDWKKIIFEAPSKKDLEPDHTTSYSPFDDDDIEEDDYLEDEDYKTPKYEKYLRIQEGAFRGWKTLEEVVLERKHTHVGSYAFDGCVSLKKVIWGDNSCSFGDRCFLSCSSLIEIGTVRGHIGSEAFKNCINLKHLIINYSPSYGSASAFLEESAFEGCTALETIKIELADTGNKVDNNKVERCYNLPCRAFFGCVALQQIHLPQDVRILEEDCFGNCSSDCVLQYEGDEFWFVGKNALPCAKAIYRWGRTVCYEHNKVVLNMLLAKLGLKREQYIEADLKHRDDYDISFSDIIKIAMGKPLSRRRKSYYSDYDSYDDCAPRTFEDAYEIYGSRLWDA